MINPDGDNAESWRDCGRMCLHTPRCKSWDFVWDEYGMCLMYMGSCTFHSRVGSIAGMKACPYGAFPGKCFSKIIFYCKNVLSVIRSILIIRISYMQHLIVLCLQIALQKISGIAVH